MCDNIPFEIQAEIMKWFPIKSLIQFRSVSKQWNSFITSSEFIADYHVSNTHLPEHLFVSYFDKQNFKREYVSFVDDDAFPINKLSPTVPLSVSKLRNQVKFVGSSNGLFCLYDICRYSAAVIWNPTIRKSIDIDLGIDIDSPYDEIETETVIDFGVCPYTLDPKIVKVTFNQAFDNISSRPWKVEVFTLSLGVWRSPLCNSLPRELIKLTDSVVDINGFLYFLAYEWIVFDQSLHRSCLIISFDLKTEEFTKIRLLNTLAYKTYSALSLSKLKESLAVFGFSFDGDGNKFCDVWMMENDVQRTVTKLFTINPHKASIRDVFGFRKSGELLIEMKTGVEQNVGLYV